MKEIILNPCPASTALAIMAIFFASSLYSYDPSILSLPYDWVRISMSFGVMLVLIASLRGFLAVKPGEAVLLYFAGDYAGTVNTPGRWWVNPLYKKTIIATKTHTYSSGLVDATDFLGDPIEIDASINWRISCPNVTLHTLDNPTQMVEHKFRAALQSLVRKYPYNNDDLEILSLKFHIEELEMELKADVTTLLAPFGIEVLTVYIGHANFAKTFLAGMSNANYLYHIMRDKQLTDDGNDPSMRLVASK